MPPTPPYVGLSLSMCIPDIASGRVPLEEVQTIRAQTLAGDEPTFNRLIEHYAILYWGSNADRCMEIARQLWQAGKIDQPRVRGLPALDVLNAIWCSPANDPYTQTPVPTEGPK